MIDRLMDFIGDYIMPLIICICCLMFFALLGCGLAVLLGWNPR